MNITDVSTQIENKIKSHNLKSKTSIYSEHYICITGYLLNSYFMIDIDVIKNIFHFSYYYDDASEEKEMIVEDINLKTVLNCIDKIIELDKNIDNTVDETERKMFLNGVSSLMNYEDAEAYHGLSDEFYKSTFEKFKRELK